MAHDSDIRTAADTGGRGVLVTTVNVVTVVVVVVRVVVTPSWPGDMITFSTGTKFATDSSCRMI